MKRKRIICWGILGICFLIGVLSAQTEKQPLTIAESSQFTATSRYSDVMDFVRIMQAQSPFIKVETMGISPEGKEIPLVIMGNPVPSSPADLKNDKRAVIYIQANIHAGEVEGKEASLMLMRDILQKDSLPYLDKLVILISPIFNIDGNEKIDPNNRRNQVGPEAGVGIRYNGQNLDLNRDSMKMESPELLGLAKNVLSRWDPILLIDCHTTNGSYHEEPVTYSWPLNPNGDKAILEYMRDIMLPAVSNQLREEYQTLSIPYGNFMGKNMEGWRTFGPQPRYVTNYMGLRNRFSILIENYAYADYKTRVLGNYYYLRAILDYCHSQREKIVSLTREADNKTIKRGLQPSDKDLFAVEFDVKPLENKVTILGWEMEINPQEGSYPRMIKTDKKKTYVLPHYADTIPTRSVRFPYGYLIPEAVPKVMQNLLQHGIIVEKLIKPTSLEVESFRVSEIKAAERLFQGHHMNSITGEGFIQTVEFPAGSLFIATAQPLGSLAAYLLEPESDDGLLVWNFFDRYLVPQWRQTPQICPVHKLLKPELLVTEIVRERP